MAFIMSHTHLSGMMDEDTMEVSSDAGRYDDFDIEIDGVNTPGTHDHLMDEEVQADTDDDMRDDVAPQGLLEEEMEDLIDDGDEVLEDIDYENEEQPHQSIHSLDYDLIDDGNIDPTPHISDQADGIVVEKQALADSGLTQSTPRAVQGEAEAPQNVHIGTDSGGYAPDPQYPPKADVQASSNSGLHGEGASATDSLPAHPDEVAHEPAQHDDGDGDVTGIARNTEPTATSDLHPCVVSWNDVEMSLFQDQDFSQFLVQDASFAHTPLAQLFSECRKVLSDSVNDLVELVFDIPQLELRIREDIVNSSTCSIADILDIYVNLNLNDGVDNPEPLRVVLFSKAKFEARIDELREAATSGHGLSRIAVLYSSDEEEDTTLDQQHGEDGINGSEHGPIAREPVRLSEGEVPVITEGTNPVAQPAEGEQTGRDEVETNPTEAVEDSAVERPSDPESTENGLHPSETIKQPLEQDRLEDEQHGDIQHSSPSIADESVPALDHDKTASSGSSTAPGDLDHQSHEDTSTYDFDANDAVEVEEEHNDHIDTESKTNVAGVDDKVSTEHDEQPVPQPQTWAEDAGESYEIDYSDDDDATTARGTDLRQDGPDSLEDGFASENAGHLQSINEETAYSRGEESTVEGDSQYFDAAQSVPNDPPDVQAEDFNEEIIDYSDDDDAGEAQETHDLDTRGHSGSNVPDQASSAHPQNSNQDPPDSLTRKRSFAEFDDLDEITEETDVKKARPA